MPYDPNWRWSPTAISLDEPNSVHSFDRWALNGWHYFFQVHPGIGKWCEIGLLGWWAGNGRTEDTVLENYVALWLTCFGGVKWRKKLVFHSQATQECMFGKACTDAGFSLDVWTLFFTLILWCFCMDVSNVFLGCSLFVRNHYSYSIHT